VKPKHIQSGQAVTIQMGGFIMTKDYVLPADEPEDMVLDAKHIE
jgi:hypothetical protein